MRTETTEKQEEYVVPKTIDSYRFKEGLKSFHVIPGPLKTESHISDHLWFCEWTLEDFLHLAPSHEVFL
jgi:hypothetical protein